MKLWSVLAVGALCAGAWLYHRSKQNEEQDLDLQGTVSPTERGEIVVATGNANKMRELRRMLEPMGWKLVSMKEKGFFQDIEENGSTFAENALIKARALWEATGCAVIADDSGLCVDALGGAPGIHSARYSVDHADTQSDDDANNQKLLRELGDRPDRAARYVCAIAWMDADGNEQVFYGQCHGSIGYEPVGADGFGYDPLFVVEDGRTMAQLSAEEKDAISHRGKAIEKLAQFLAEQ